MNDVLTSPVQVLYYTKTTDITYLRFSYFYLDLPTVELPGKDDINMLGFESVGHRVRSQCGYIPPAMNTVSRKQQRQL